MDAVGSCCCMWIDGEVQFAAFRSWLILKVVHEVFKGRIVLLRSFALNQLQMAVRKWVLL